jgi:hypothetical protein
MCLISKEEKTQKLGHDFNLNETMGIIPVVSFSFNYF